MNNEPLYGGALACLLGCAGCGAAFAFLVIAKGLIGGVPLPVLIAPALLGPAFGALLGLKRAWHTRSEHVFIASAIFPGCLVFVCLLGYSESGNLANLAVALWSAGQALLPYVLYRLLSRDRHANGPPEGGN